MIARCKEPGCKKKVVARGLCITHYQALRRSGDFEPRIAMVPLATHVPAPIADAVRAKAKRLRISVSATISTMLGRVLLEDGDEVS